MKNLHLLLVLFLCLGMTSCTKNIETDCIDSMLEANDMIPYTDSGQENGCKSFLELYHFRGKQYFVLGNHCIDMISFPVSCDGEVLCDGENDFKCGRFESVATRIGIVGVEE